MTDLSNLVKPLVWDGDPDTRTKADVYSVRPTYGQGSSNYLLARSSNVIGRYDNPEAAKSAAQSDYTDRIIAALDPDAVAKIREDALREAATVALGMNNGETAKAIHRAILALIDKKDTAHDRT